MKGGIPRAPGVLGSQIPLGRYLRGLRGALPDLQQFVKHAPLTSCGNAQNTAQMNAEFARGVKRL